MHVPKMPKYVTLVSVGAHSILEGHSSHAYIRILDIWGNTFSFITNKFVHYVATVPRAGVSTRYIILHEQISYFQAFIINQKIEFNIDF